MKRLVRWFLWSPRRAALGAGALVVVLFVALLGAAEARQWVAYFKAKEAYEARVAAEEAGTVVAPNTAGGSVPLVLGTPDDGPVPTGAPQPGVQLGKVGSPPVDAPSTASSAPSAPAATIEHSDADVADPDATVAVLATGDAFARIFFTAAAYPDTAAWAAELDPLTTPALRPYLAAVDLAGVPSGTPTGEPLEVGPYSATLAYPLADGTRLEVLLVLDAVDGWRVSDYRPLP